MTSSDNMLNAVIFVLGLNLLIFFVGGAITSLGGSSPFDDAQNPLMKFNAKEGNFTNPELPANYTGFLPSGVQAVEPDTGGFFTDIFSSIKSWVVDATGLGWLLSILSGPKVLLAAMGLPDALAWAIAALWYGVSILIIASYIFGR